MSSIKLRNIATNSVQQYTNARVTDLA
uniref:Uncharacterized protein n=1 Tax=Anguilla anguilla TaxID=7936 RepID=A0A0E9Q6R5_ANGAN